MARKYHPKFGSVITVDFDGGFKVPEMVKRRLCVVVSKPMKSRKGLCTVVPLSTTVPHPPENYHCELDIDFDLPTYWGRRKRWVKGDMVAAIGFHRADLLRLGKDISGKRIYQTRVLPQSDVKRIQACILHGLGLSKLTKSL